MENFRWCDVVYWSDVAFGVFLVFVPIVLLLIVLVAKRKGWLKIEGRSWRDAENYVRRKRCKAEKSRSVKS